MHIRGYYWQSITQKRAKLTSQNNDVYVTCLVSPCSQQLPDTPQAEACSLATAVNTARHKRMQELK
jgi:hypothetical protein